MIQPINPQSKERHPIKDGANPINEQQALIPSQLREKNWPAVQSTIEQKTG